MIQPEFLYKLRQLPADTPITANHIVAILDTISSVIDKSSGIDFDSLPNSKLINEDMLADWLDESNSTLQKWRVKGGGPNYVRGPKSVRYSVGAVRDWIDSRTVKSTNESFAKGLSKLEILNNSYNINSDTVNFPMMIVDNSHIDFFNSFEGELNIEGHSVICLKTNSALNPLVLDANARLKAEKILNALDSFNRSIIKDPKNAHKIYGDWKSKIDKSQRLGYFSVALAFDLNLAIDIGSEITDQFLIENFNPASWFLSLLTNQKSETIDNLDLNWSFKYLLSRGIDINSEFRYEDRVGNVIFDGTIAHLLANSKTSFYQINNLYESESILGGLLNDLLSLGLNIDLKSQCKEKVSARQMAELLSEKSETHTAFLSTVTKRELYEKLLNSK